MTIIYPRILDLPSLLSRKSQFLFGPRQTGKTTLVREMLPDAMVGDEEGEAETPESAEQIHELHVRRILHAILSDFRSYARIGFKAIVERIEFYPQIFANSIPMCSRDS